LAGILCFAFLLMAASTSNVSAAPFFEFRLNSDTGDFVGQGQSHLREQTTGVIDIYTLLDQTGDGAVDSLFLRYLGNQQGQFIHFGLGTNQLGTNLLSGVYPNAERAPFATVGHPGLDVTIDGHGCNMVAGSFVIHDVAFVAGPTLDRLDVEFQQHCEGAIPALTGRFRYDRLNPLQALAVTAVPTMNLTGLATLSVLILLAAIILTSLKFPVSTNASGGSLCSRLRLGDRGR